MKSAVIALLFAVLANARQSLPLQPLAQQVRQIAEALTYLGDPLSSGDLKKIDEAIANPNESAAIDSLQAILDRRVLVTVDINAESRVKVEQGAAQPELVEAGTRLFLVKVLNRAGVTAELRVASPNSGNVYITSNGDSEPKITLTPSEAADRWADISLYHKPPMTRRLSGLPVEYQVLEVYSRDGGQRAAKIGFNVGQGSQDIGFRNDVSILFNALPAKTLTLHVKDENGQPAMASFVIRGQHDRLYPAPSKRLAPDLPFQPQVYRQDGETVRLPAGYYTFEVTGGPEYLTHTREVAVTGEGPDSLDFQLDRWIDPSKLNWYSGDHHVHAAGCSHYMNPAEGVEPKDMVRQLAGERLNIGSVLTWGPDYYYQKQFFCAKDDPLSKPGRIMHYDLEVSGFPSSHAGHLVLLGLKEQSYPGAKRIENWPTWDLPILRWAKSQGAIVGFAHSGWGLEVSSGELPSYEMPGFDGIGANEYIIDVTHPDTVDFISAVDTPYPWELNIWYHTLNVGFRTRIAGETDFPCIYDGRVGIGRTYARLDGPLTYQSWLSSLKAGRSYVSDGKTHLMDFKVNNVEAGNASDLKLSGPAPVKVTMNVAAYLPPIPNEKIRKLPFDEKPYWDIERARIGDSREIPVEIVVNGLVAARKTVLADGKIHPLEFSVQISESSWIAARVLPAAHTNPIFAMVRDRPIRASRRSAEWCLNAVNQCWTQKVSKMSPGDQAAARTAYDHARDVYRRLIGESEHQ